MLDVCSRLLSLYLLTDAAYPKDNLGQTVFLENILDLILS